jgi:hypothetical protein
MADCGIVFIESRLHAEPSCVKERPHQEKLSRLGQSLTLILRHKCGSGDDRGRESA